MEDTSPRMHSVGYSPVKLCWGKRVYIGFFLVHLYSVVVRWPCLLNIKMDGDSCVAGWVIKGKYAKLTSNMYGVFEFIVHYLVHMIALLYLYGKVISVSNKVLKKQEDTTSANTQKALSVVTRASIAVTVVFILTFSWNSWNYTPGVLFGWFAVGSPWQKTNVLMGAINSACNPIFYALFMPSFRRAVINTFIPCWAVTSDGVGGTSNSQGGSSQSGSVGGATSISNIQVATG